MLAGNRERFIQGLDDLGQHKRFLSGIKYKTSRVKFRGWWRIPGEVFYK
jgi:hypothetical protein